MGGCCGIPPGMVIKGAYSMYPLLQPRGRGDLRYSGIRVGMVAMAKNLYIPKLNILLINR